MTRKKGTIPYSGNFEVKIAEPLDARGRVATKAELLLPATWTSSDGLIYTYVGMHPSVYADSADNNGIYILIAEDYKLAASWKAAGTVPVLATALLDGLLSKEDFAKLVTLVKLTSMAGHTLTPTVGDIVRMPDNTLDIYVVSSIDPTDFFWDGYGVLEAGINYLYLGKVYLWNGTSLVVQQGLPEGMVVDVDYTHTDYNYDAAAVAEVAKIEGKAPQTTTYTKTEIDAKLTHSYTLDFQTSVTILQDINLEGSIQITEIHKNNVATLLLGVTDVATLTLPYTITNNTLLAWTITRTIAGMASVGIKYIKI